MGQEARPTVLVAVSSTPVLLIKVGLSYLRLKRAADKARGRFYQELIGSGLSETEARLPADGYASPVSVRNILDMARGGAARGGIFFIIGGAMTWER